VKKAEFRGINMPKDKKSSNKEKKHFFKDFKAELKKVIWPTPKQLVNNTVAVITIVLITAAIVFVLDFAFEKINTYGINKLKTVVNSNVSTEDTDTEEDESSEEILIDDVEETESEDSEETSTENDGEEEQSESEVNE
jgi:preprotein translocase subunit SecE